MLVRRVTNSYCEVLRDAATSRWSEFLELRASDRTTPLRRPQAFHLRNRLRLPGAALRLRFEAFARTVLLISKDGYGVMILLSLIAL